MLIDPGVAALEQLADTIRSAPVKRRFVLLVAERFGWTGTYTRWLSRVDQWCDPDDPHRFPVEAQADAITASGGGAQFLDPLLGLEVKLARQRRSKPVKVEPNRKGRAA